MNSLLISHTTEYAYDSTPSSGLLQVRLTPKTDNLQKPGNWVVDMDGGRQEVLYTDHNGNLVQLFSYNPAQTKVSLRAHGQVDIEENAGVVGEHFGPAPLAYYLRHTDLTRPGQGIAGLLGHIASANVNEPSTWHDLSKTILNDVEYATATTDVMTTAETAIENGMGVCQDHAHILVSIARQMGIPARYVSGYLMMTDRIEQEATHAWAECYLDGLGWTGFDVSNGISPDSRYVRLATGLDYADAAPISGLRVGGGTETLNVTLDVQQQQ